MTRNDINDDAPQITSTSPIISRDTIPVIVRAPRKWFFCRSVRRSIRVQYTLPSTIFFHFYIYIPPPTEREQCSGKMTFLASIKFTSMLCRLKCICLRAFYFVIIIYGLLTNSGRLNRLYNIYWFINSFIHFSTLR